MSAHGSIPGTKTARQSLMVDILRRETVRSQTELLTRLKHAGVEVTQATLSRDLVELGAVKVRTPDGAAYAVPGEGGDRSLQQGIAGDVLDAKLERHLEELLVSVDYSGNLAILRTPPGAAQFLASTIDKSTIKEILGTIAGDDTIMVIGREGHGGQAIAQKLLTLAGFDNTAEVE